VGQWQGRQMVYFQTKNHNLGKFRRVLEWKKIGTFYVYSQYIMPILYILMSIW
jgi:hypothetical protein